MKMLSASCGGTPSQYPISLEYTAPQFVEALFLLVVHSPFVRGQTSKDLILPSLTLLSGETRQFGFFRLLFHDLDL